MRRWIAALSTALILAAPARAQGVGMAGELCQTALLPGDLGEACTLAVQSVRSAQPQLALLLTGGNPTPGTAGVAGLRLGLLPRVSAGLGLNVVFAELPDLLLERAGPELRTLNREIGVPVPALNGTASVGLFPGFSAAPTLGGIGSLDLIGGVHWLPLEAFDADGFGDRTSSFSYAVGGRVGLLRESFGVPGVSVSLLYHQLGELAYGDVCPASASRPALGGGTALEVNACAGGGDVGEFAFDLDVWSARGVVSKQLLGLGLAAGVGYDHSTSDVAIGFGGLTPLGDQRLFARLSGLSLESGRWLAFGDLSYTLLIATLSAEAGWMQGGDAVTGWRALQSEFDPGQGTWFGNLAVRLTL